MAEAGHMTRPHATFDKASSRIILRVPLIFNDKARDPVIVIKQRIAIKHDMIRVVIIDG